jgi:hypothetical protein
MKRIDAPFSWRALELSILLATLLTLAGSCSRQLQAQPLPRIDFTTHPWTHTITPSTPCEYSGSWLICGHQWGGFVLNSSSSLFTMLSGVGKTGTGFQPPAIYITGDCWQSETRIVASKDTPKWVVWTGTPPTCAASGTPLPAGEVQVYRLDAPLGFRRVGQVIAPLVNRNSGPLVLDGDFAYGPEGLFPATTWTKIDLNTLTVLATGVIAPAPNEQPNIGGYTYSLVKTGPQTYYALRSGAAPSPTPAVTPLPTPTPVANPFASHIEALYDAGITAGCGAGNFCPTRLMTRQEVAAWLAIGLHLQINACRGVFKDVPCPLPGFRAVQP